MGQPFASGKKAFGFCSRCGFRYDLKDMNFQIIKQKRTDLLVCPECLDIDHEQLMLGSFPIHDPQALRNPRPEPTLVQSRDIQWGWNPVASLTLTASVGSVTVTVTVVT